DFAVCFDPQHDHAEFYVHESILDRVGRSPVTANDPREPGDVFPDAAGWGLPGGREFRVSNSDCRARGSELIQRYRDQWIDPAVPIAIGSFGRGASATAISES